MVMGRNGYGPKLSWAEMVMGRNDPESSYYDERKGKIKLWRSRSGAARL